MIDSSLIVKEFIKKIDFLEDKSSFKALFFSVAPILLLISLPFDWTGNEENYFQLALRRVSPDLFTHYHAVFDESDGRFFFETLLGSLISILGYELSHDIARLLNVFSLSAGLAVFFHSIRLPVTLALGTVVIFHLLGQQFFGGEWIFGGVEAKTFAYACVFASLGLMLTNKWAASLFFIVLATYFHFLVGGFWSLLLIGYSGVSASSLNKSLKVFVYYSLAILPLVVLLAFDQFSGGNGDLILDVNQLYVDRNAHHIAPFHSLSGFYNDWSNGLAFLISFGIALLFIKLSKSKNPLIDISLALVFYLLFSLCLAFLDRNTHIFSKFYIFRPSSLILFISIVCVMIYFNDVFSRMNKRFLSVSLIPLLLYFVAVESISVMGHYIQYKGDRYSSYYEVIEAIRSRAEADKIILIETPPFEYRRIVFHRKLKNPTLVSYKFVPTTPTDIHEWKERLDFKRSVFENGCNIDIWKYPVQYVVTFSKESRERLEACSSLLWAGSKDVSLMKIHL